MQKLGCVLPSALTLLLAFASMSAARATEVLSVTDKKVEIRVSDDLPLSSDQMYYLLDKDSIRRGIVKIENVIDDVAFGELMMGSAEPQMKLELRARKTARRGRAGNRSPASVAESGDSTGDERSDYWWTPKPGSFSVSAYFATASASYSVSYSKQSIGVTESLSAIGTSVMYSFSDRFSLGVNWSLSNSDTLKIASYTITKSGPADPVIGALYQNKDGDAIYFFGLSASINMGPQKVPGRDAPGNYSSGGIGIKPLLGLLVHAGDHYFGTQVAYNYRLPATAQSSDGGTSYQLTGGNIISLEMYYEYHDGDWIYSPIIGFDSHDASSSTSNGSTSTGTDPYTVPHWQLKAIYSFMPQLSGSLSLISQQIYFASNADSPVYANAYGGEATLRYEF